MKITATGPGNPASIRRVKCPTRARRFASPVSSSTRRCAKSPSARSVTGCESHHNALGQSGTAGNSVYFHGNDYHDNGAGYVTDSFVPNHPGMPQECYHWTNNEIYSNNSNWYTRFVDTGICQKPMKDRGYIHGTVCPVVPTPVGTGVLIAGVRSARCRGCAGAASPCACYRASHPPSTAIT